MGMTAAGATAFLQRMGGMAAEYAGKEALVPAFLEPVAAAVMEIAPFIIADKRIEPKRAKKHGDPVPVPCKLVNKFSAISRLKQQLALVRDMHDEPYTL
jgi:hypothetical protein